MEMKIGVIKGDGIGPEIVDEAMKVLDQTAKVYGHSISYTQLLMGGASIDVNGVPLTEETLQLAKDSDAVLMGSIGGDAKTSPWYQLEPSKRPEAGLLQLRKGLNLFANLRPAVLYDELKGACPLKKEIADRGFDLMIMRELTGGLYFGKRSTEEIDGVLTAKDELTYNENLSIIAAERIVAIGFAIPFPAISGAEPPLGSYRPNFVSFRLALASIPIEPVTILASSDKISPNMFSVRTTSNCAGSFTSCIAQLSTSICSNVTSG